MKSARRWLALVVLGTGLATGVILWQSDLRFTFLSKPAEANGPDPLPLAAGVALGLDGDGSDCKVHRTDAEAEGGDRYVVVVTNDNCRDDSVRSTRVRVDVERQPAGAWRAVWVGIKWRCYRDFSMRLWTASPCS